MVGTHIHELVARLDILPLISDSTQKACFEVDFIRRITDQYFFVLVIEINQLDIS